jgi:hypothetical protein
VVDRCATLLIGPSQARQLTRFFFVLRSSFFFDEPGGAAHISTHTICFARLIIDEKDYGVHSFLVQLRDRDGNILPGITIGDCGKKMGRDGIDNGWLQFNNVRVPRSQMLQKWAKVSREVRPTMVASPPLCDECSPSFFVLRSSFFCRACTASRPRRSWPTEPCSAVACR